MSLRTGAWSLVLISPLWPKNQKLILALGNLQYVMTLCAMTLWAFFWGYRGDIRTELQAPARNNIVNDLVSFWFWGYRCDIRTELQAPEHNVIVSFWFWGYRGDIRTELQAPVRNVIVSFWFWGYRGVIRTELQAPVIKNTVSVGVKIYSVKSISAPWTQVCDDVHIDTVKTGVKRPLSKWTKIGFQYQLSLNAGQKYCRMLQGAFCNTFDLH